MHALPEWCSGHCILIGWTLTAQVHKAGMTVTGRPITWERALSVDELEVRTWLQSPLPASLMALGHICKAISHRSLSWRTLSARRLSTTATASGCCARTRSWRSCRSCLRRQASSSSRPARLRPARPCPRLLSLALRPRTWARHC